jgi:hypothetical protein
MKLYMIHGRDSFGADDSAFRTYLIAAPDESEARKVVPDGFEVMSVEVSETTDKSAHVLFWTAGAIEPIDW